jgi:hypothetical protein
LNKDPRFFSNIKAAIHNAMEIVLHRSATLSIGANLGQQSLKLSDDHHQDLSQLHQPRYIHIASQVVSTPERSTTMIRAGNIWDWVKTKR